jgi:hypothetical protein
MARHVSFEDGIKLLMELEMTGSNNGNKASSFSMPLEKKQKLMPRGD